MHLKQLTKLAKQQAIDNAHGVSFRMADGTWVDPRTVKPISTYEPPNTPHEPSDDD